MPDYLVAGPIAKGQLVELLPSAFVIAFLAAVESLLPAMVADRMIGGAHRPNAEVMAQGWANIGSGLFGGLPATGAIARTATNVRAGARGPVAGMLHALFLLGFMLIAAPLAVWASLTYGAPLTEPLAGCRVEMHVEGAPRWNPRARPVAGAELAGSETTPISRFSSSFTRIRRSGFIAGAAYRVGVFFSIS